MKKPTYLFLHICIGFSAKAQKNLSDNANVNDLKIEFVKKIHDESVNNGSDGSCRFVFKNTGNEPIILSKVTSHCGCMIPSWPTEPVFPGSSGVIKVVYDNRKNGMIIKTMKVMTNAWIKIVYRLQSRLSKEHRIVFLLYGCSCYPICYEENTYRYS